MQQIFEKFIRIRFCHCDPAGIVYHPRFFTIFNGVIEDFFREVLGKPFEGVVNDGYGFPVVGIRTDFVNAVHVGANARVRLWIEKIGVSSVRFAITLDVEGVECVKTAETCAFIQRENTMQACALPDWMKEKLTPYVIDDVSSALALRA